MVDGAVLHVYVCEYVTHQTADPGFAGVRPAAAAAVGTDERRWDGLYVLQSSHL